MKRVRKAIVAVVLMSLAISSIGCKKVENNNDDAKLKVTTVTPHDITQTSAVCGCEVTVDEDVLLTEIGVCWDTESNPTVESAHLSSTLWGEPFECILTRLEPNTQYFVRAYALRGVSYYYGDEKSFTTYGNGGGGSIYEGNSIDLGLPSGTLWADCNIGATTPEEYGWYFAWGETQTKGYYDWSSYKYGSDVKMLTKYCTVSEYGLNGFVDNLVTLMPGDDAAVANCGENWRTPTGNEWAELFANTASIWTTLNGVSGRLFTASNGNSIFLPAAGRRYDDGIVEAGNYGTYWSSSLYSDSPFCAWDLNFYSNRMYLDGGGRYLGFTIRPVRSAH